MPTVHGTTSVIGSGIYDLLEAGHLLQIDPRKIRRWSKPGQAGAPLVEPTHSWAFSFHDLVSLGIIGVLVDRGIRRKQIRVALDWLEREFDTSRPLAHQEVVDALATYGRSLVIEDRKDGGIYNLGVGGQGTLADLVRPLLRPLEYGPDRLASLMRPAELVLVDPDIQVGHPCVEGTRVTTDVIVERLDQGETVQALANDLLLGVQEVEAAIAFERSLEAGHGLFDVAA